MRTGFFSRLISVALISVVINTVSLPQRTMALEIQKPILEFPVISDVHIGGINTQAKFENALKDLKVQFPNYDAIVTNGDNTDAGTEEQYNLFMNILNSNKVKGAESIIAMGNHEYYSRNTDIKGSQDRFILKTGMANLNYDKWIKGYHFIVLAPENLGNGGSGVIVTDNQLKWLDEKLKENEKQNKPSFVFLHQPMNNTVYGSDTCDNVENSEQLASVLKKHPEAVYFSGHSHYLLEHPRTIYQNVFTMINTGAIYYMMSEGDKYEEPSLAEGLVVQVYSNKIVVRYREFSKHKWVGRSFIQLNKKLNE